jgi:glycosyltransferase involved in cell wall biosynthesis
MNPHPISFIIPAYNCAATVEESVRSILKTNFQKGDEIIIVDDKSTDHTLSVIKQLASSNSNIRVIEHANNQGGGAARNTAAKNSQHDLIFCLDSDNVLEKNSIAPLKQLLLSSHSDVASFQTLKFFKKTPAIINHRWVFKKSPIELSDLFDCPIVPPASGNYLYTKQSWVQAGGYPEFAGALDAWGFGLRQLATGAKMSILPDSYYFHRFGNESYWVRESKNGLLSTLATEIVLPYKNAIDKDIWAFIEQNPTDWFEHIGNISSKSNSENIGIIIPPFKDRAIKNIKKMIPSFIKTPLKKFALYRSFLSDYHAFRKASETSSRFPMEWNDRYPQLYDKTTGTDFDAHYLYHPAWAARIIAKTNPSKHVDISSILHFSTLVSAFVPVEFYDYRPAAITLSGLTCGSADLTDLHFPTDSIESLSCMHTIEHIGLGRYGDPIDPDGDLKAIKELVRVLAPGGTLLFVTPVGKPRIQFNAHRIYSYDQITNYFSDLKLEEFSLIPDNGVQVGIIKDATKELADAQAYGCGCFWFKKP